MPKLNEKFETLEPLKMQLSQLLKLIDLLFQEKTDRKWCNNWNITKETKKIKKTTKHDRCPVYIRAIAKYCSIINLSNKPIWIVTRVTLKHNHSMLKADKITTFPQYHVMNLAQKTANKINNSEIIHSKNVINKHACIRIALNESSNDNSTQKLLKLLKEHDYIIVSLKTIKNT
ncbi:8655_t:CDS:2 [Cetraspora pellucida]|uniref:8655_t:CDS:1 n=1 Tax=Cetraspora pellucida TaxID=1433469 RepID=A0A9N9DLY8_9GLOM|nr:8655_t:CDS:2 [Cetraspora pellucida]